MRFSKKSKLFSVFFGILLCFLATQLFTESTWFTSFAANFLFNHNLHEVVPGRFFRSAEMSRADLATVIDKYKIKSVLDLRLDKDAADESGKSEAEVTAEHGATYYAIPMSSAKARQYSAVLELLDKLPQMQTPILVHCSSGTHRSGFASALFLSEVEGRVIDEAMEQISLKYGFIKAERDLKAWAQGEPTLDSLLREYKEYRLKELRENEKKLGFRQWLEKRIAEENNAPQ